MSTLADQTPDIPLITLHDGSRIPQIGLGVLRIDDEGVVPVVESALAIGYRHIDGAAGYNNEEGVGRALAATGYNTRVRPLARIAAVGLCGHVHDPLAHAVRLAQRRDMESVRETT